jgi:protein gp37
VSGNSAIEWTDATWNPVTGCTRVSPGCAHCYALDLAARLKRMGQPRYQRDGGRGSGPGFGVTLHEDLLGKPLGWRKPRRVFVNSMSDLFHEEIPFEFIAAVYGVMAATPRHTFQVLTKRPERALEFFAWHAEQVKTLDVHWEAWQVCEDAACVHVEHLPAAAAGAEWPPRNVWVGVSIENRRFVHRADLLRETPAAVRFISAEPLLGPLVARFEPDGELGEWIWPDGRISDGSDSLSLNGIDWLIVGGESGARHRPIDPQWVRDLRDACACPLCGFDRSEGCDFCSTRLYRSPAFFFKQWGGRTPKSGGRELDGRTWDEMPETRQAVPA